MSSPPLEPMAPLSILPVKGQSLIGIAEAYQVPLDEILQLNNLTLDSIIYPGEEILIRPANYRDSNPPSHSNPAFCNTYSLRHQCHPDPAQQLHTQANGNSDS